MAVQDLTIPYPDFKFDEIINPEAFDLNNEAVKAKLNELIALLNNKETLDSTWVSAVLENGWTNFNANSYPIARYKKDSLGFVCLEGFVAGTLSTTSTVFTLPVGYRPTKTIYFSTVCSVGSSDVFGNGQINHGTGVVQIFQSKPSWASLNNIRFSLT
jgi:hypothetical protein